MNRRQFLNLAAGGAAAVVTSLTGCESKPSKYKIAKENLPNILFIMADDLGYADLGCYGQKHIKTPNIDQLAAEGTRFTQCYAGSTVCAPSRSVLMTGQHTGHTRVRGNSGKVGGVGPQRRVPLKTEDVTLAEILKKEGYTTAITGKWGLGEPGTTGIPNRQGFDEWFGYLNQRNAHSYYPPFLWRNRKKQILEGNEDGQKKQYSHDLITEFALDFIRRHEDEPFFLYLPYTIPHAKYEIPGTEPYTEKPWPQDAKVHAAMITRMDRDIGSIMALLKSLEIDQKTIVFFCSDNGAANRWQGLFDSSGPLRGRKRDMYEGGIRTPMIVRWPGLVPASKTSDSVWYFADVLPTLAQLLRIKPPANIDGISIVPTLFGMEQNTSNRFLYWEFPSGGFKQAVRWRNYKAVRLAPDKPLELYDLEKDLAEQNNIADRNPDVVAKIEAYLKTARTDSPNWPIK
ncbi:MAG TPA: arylsulfatase [Planctomycetes bacterium]|nr:arylsulfatase [Planctomycetota bacterium]